MPTVRYTVVYGEVISEKRGGVRRQYVPDPLGSTVALLDSTQAQTDTFSYWPYGEITNRMGLVPTPFQYVGTLGYFTDKNDRIYIRKRFLSAVNAKWVSPDPSNFSELENDYNLFAYAKNSPTSYIDRTGMKPGYSFNDDECSKGTGLNKIPCPSWVGDTKRKLCSSLISYGEDNLVRTGCLIGIEQARCLVNWCKGNSNIYCQQNGSFGGGVGDCRNNTCGWSCGRPGSQFPGHAVFLCLPVIYQKGCDGEYASSNPGVLTILHELFGICGSHHYDSDTQKPEQDSCNIRAKCLLPYLGF